MTVLSKNIISKFIEKLSYFYHMKKLLIFLFFLVLSYFVLKYNLNLFITFDEGYNLQVPRSLNENFIYQNRYNPRKIADINISTGFPIHYLQFFYFKILGENFESVRLLTSTLIIALFFLLFLYHKNLLTSFYIFSLFLTISWFRRDLSGYLGETISFLFLLISHIFLKQHIINSKKRLKQLLLSSLFFSFAVHSKFISIFIVLLFLSYENFKFKDKIKFILSSFFFYFFINLFLIIYSYILKFNSINGLKTYIINYAVEYKYFLIRNSTKIPFNLFDIKEIVLNKINETGGIINFIFLIILPLIITVFSKFSIYNLGLTLVILKIFFTLYWRHYLIFMLIFFTVASKELIHFKIYRIFLLILIIINLGFFITKGKNIFFSEIANSQKINKETIKIAKFIDSIDGEIITNGWWQSPDKSFYTKKIFTNRMELVNYKNNKNIYLLTEAFQGKAWPQTNLNNFCEKIVLCRQDILICLVKKGVLLNQIEKEPQGTKLCPQFKYYGFY